MNLLKWLLQKMCIYFHDDPDPEPGWADMPHEYRDTK